MESDMRYISTRGGGAIGFDDVLLSGLAADGGLYVPQTWPVIDATALAGKSYIEIAEIVIRPFVQGAISDAELHAVLEKAYGSFRHTDIAPLVKLDDDLWLMELFHGPTLAFKDVALQLLGQLFDHVLAQKQQQVTVIGATSGDTGSAAIEACKNKANVSVFILHPHERVSEVQRRQMTSVQAGNIHNIAIKGDFDHCQALVKAMFADVGFRQAMNLTTINSINWARIMAQVVYYFVTAVKIGKPVSFAVPTGNFGNVYAAYVAKQMGAPVGKLIVGTNQNDILHRFFETGKMTRTAVVPTISPSMDIQISSNFERLLFEMTGRDSAIVQDMMNGLSDTGAFEVTPDIRAATQADFLSHRLDDEETREVIKSIHGKTGQVVDPHTAVGLGAALHYKDQIDTPIVALACAHPSKFPEAVQEAIGETPALPDFLSDLMQRPERCIVLENDFKTVQDFVRAHGSLSKNQTATL